MKDFYEGLSQFPKSAGLRIKFNACIKVFKYEDFQNYHHDFSDGSFVLFSSDSVFNVCPSFCSLVLHPLLHCLIEIRLGNFPKCLRTWQRSNFYLVKINNTIAPRICIANYNLGLNFVYFVYHQSSPLRHVLSLPFY